MTTFSARADYHQMYLAPFGRWPEYDMAQEDALIQTMPDERSIIIASGIAAGPVTIDVELVASPEAAANDGWEESFDGHMVIDDPPLFMWSPTSDQETGPVFDPPAKGRYGFRLSCRGRGLAYDRTVFEPVEHYLLQFWPSD